MNRFLAILGIMGGLTCACADLLLDLKGADNQKLGKMGIMDSKWETMPGWRFWLSGVLAMFAVPMYCCGAIALGNEIAKNAPGFGTVFQWITCIGAMGGFMIHIFLCICPTIYKDILSDAGFELAEKVISDIFRQIYIPFFTCYTMLVIISSGMIIVGIGFGIVVLPFWCILMNPLAFQLMGLLLRATKLPCFIDAPSCCAASLGLAMFGVLALM